MPAIIPLKATELRRLQKALLGWYDANRRNLPWRDSDDPYAIWVSEIMLQQTRVAVVRDYYARWMQRFPTVQKLAAARLSSVLTVWSGLGYYHRARRMRETAKVVVRERGGEFPTATPELRRLPGIGPYTAAAIASIAFEAPVAVVDGNVGRVLDRLFATAHTKAGHWQGAAALLTRKRPGDFNQAMMELGATICTPRAPQCLVCPIMTWCRSRGAETLTRPKTRKRRTLWYGFAEHKGSILLVQRGGDSSLMAGMWELPVVAPSEVSSDTLITLRHSITDTDYLVKVRRLDACAELATYRGSWFKRQQWQRLPLTGLARKIVQRVASGVHSATERI